MSAVSFESRVDARRKAFKKGCDGEDARRKREDEALSLRKQKKDEQMQKKRMFLDPAQDQENQENQENACGNAPAKPKSQPCSTDGLATLHAQLQVPTLSAESRLAIVVDIRKRLSRASSPPTQEAIDAQLIPLMVQYLASEDTKLQFEASWVLTNLASGDSEQTAAVVHGGAVPNLAALLTSPLLENREQAAWCLGNILGDSPALRNRVLEFNVIPSMLQLIVLAEQAGKVSALQNATWAMSNVFRGKPGPDLAVVGPAIPYLVQLMHHADAGVKVDTLWTLSYLCDGDPAKIDAFCSTGALPHVVQHLSHADFKIVQPALRCVGNVACGADQHTQLVVDSGVLQHVGALLARPKPSIRKEAMWLASNVTAGTVGQIQAVLDAGLMAQLVDTAKSDCFDVKKEALWAVANAAVGGTPAQLEALAEAGAVTLCAESLDRTTEGATLGQVLDALKAFLVAGQRMENAGLDNVFSRLVEEADGLTKLENLQEDAEAEIYEKAVGLIESFFETDEVADDAAPAADFRGGLQAFNFA